MLKKWVFSVLLFSAAIFSQTVSLYAPMVEMKDGDSTLINPLTERILQELEKSTVFKTVAEVSDSLSENDSCAGIDCLIRNAKKADAEQALFTSVTKFGGLWSLSAKLFDVKSGDIVFSVVEDCKCEDEDFYLTAPETLVKKMSDHVELGRRIAVSITTLPDSVTLFVNEKEVGITPYQKEIRKAGNYVIRLVKAGYDDIFDTLELVAGTEVKFQYELSHSQAYLDSVEAARNDSIMVAAKKSMKNSLPEALTQLTISLTGSAEDNRIAVLPFETTDSLKDASKMASEYTVSYLSSRPDVTLIDRENFHKVIKEIELSYSGMMSDETALEAGNMLTANYLITGTVNSFDRKETVFLRLLDVETNRIVTASSAQLSEDVVDQMTIDVFGERVKPSSALFRSLVAPGWGQFYTNRPAHGIVSIALVSVGVGASIYTGIDYKQKSDEVDKYIAKDPSTLLDGDTPATWAARAESKEQEMNDAQDYFRYALIGTGVLWIGNVIDATILGAIEAKNIKDLYFSAVPDRKGNVTFAANLTLGF